MTRVFYLDFTLAQQFGYSVTPKNVIIMLTMLEKPVFYYSSPFFLPIHDQTQNLQDELPYHKDLFKIKTPVRFLEGSFLQQGRKSTTILSHKQRFLPPFAETGTKIHRPNGSKARIQQWSTTTWEIIVLLVPLHRRWESLLQRGKKFLTHSRGITTWLDESSVSLAPTSTEECRNSKSSHLKPSWTPICALLTAQDRA